uniref:NADH dehydrogenase subunit 2 n=1 Tax=Proteomonas sulcata TaxID=77928 RepID=A0A2P1G8B5_9CRYP|nr:NADH dehydrogenase subunit 2 [Proteomonas sulcata]AVM81207.1 NADH dehydrogenase subunit 2 [Proteomonas sulcata]
MEFTFDIDWIAAISEIYLIFIINILIVYAVIYSTSPHLHYPVIVKNVTWLSIQTLFFMLILTTSNILQEAVIFNNLLIIDNFTTLIKTIVLVSTIIVLLIITQYNKIENFNYFEYVILILLACSGILLLISSYDLISLYLALELQSFCLYILACLKRTSEFSTEAGLKYFILGAFSSGFLLFGCSLVYGFTGTTNFEQLFHIFTGIKENSLFYSIIIIVGFVFVTIGILFKLAVAPFHLWVPDVYEGAPTSVVAFFAIVPKIALVSLLVRLLFYVFYNLYFPWEEVLILCSIFSILIGTFGALIQKKVKRLIAYSSIAHSGYILIGISCGSLEGIYAAFFYSIIYIIMTILSFTILLSVRTKNHLNKIKYLNDLAGLYLANLPISLVFAIVFFSMCGIPPLAGFFSKLFIFFAALNMSLYSLTIFAALMSAVACFYYLRIIKIIFFDKPGTNIILLDIDKEKSLILSICSILLIIFFFWPAPLILFIHNGILCLCI